MKRIVCFHSDVDFGVTTHLPVLVEHPQNGTKELENSDRRKKLALEQV